MQHVWCVARVLAPHQLLAYRHRRVNKLHWRQDGIDVGLLENWTVAEARACAEAGGRLEANRSTSAWAAPRCI